MSETFAFRTFFIRQDEVRSGRMKFFFPFFAIRVMIVEARIFERRRDVRRKYLLVGGTGRLYIIRRTERRRFRFEEETGAFL